MKPRVLLLTSMCLLGACGSGTEEPGASGGIQQDEVLTQRGEVLAAHEAIAKVRAGLIFEPGRGEFCVTQVLQPRVQGTVWSIPKLDLLRVAPLGDEVRSGYLRTDETGDVFFRGIAEFALPANVTWATLRFIERRAQTETPAAPDTHLISAFPGDLELNGDDFFAQAVVVGRFETDANQPPWPANAYDVTRAVRALSPNIAFRFELEDKVGGSTVFSDLSLQVMQCRGITLER
jgi:hypothetical protein